MPFFWNRLHVRNCVRIIEVSDNRGTDNWGRTTCVVLQVYWRGPCPSACTTLPTLSYMLSARHAFGGCTYRARVANTGGKQLSQTHNIHNDSFAAPDWAMLVVYITNKKRLKSWVHKSTCRTMFSPHSCYPAYMCYVFWFLCGGGGRGGGGGGGRWEKSPIWCTKDDCVYKHSWPGYWLFFHHLFYDLSKTVVSVTVELGSWFEYEKAWWEHRHDPNVLLVKYEDMHAVSYVPWTGGHSRSGMGWLVFLVCVTHVSFIPNFYPAWDKGYVSGQAFTIYVVISLNTSGTCIKRVEVIESFQLHWPHRRRTSPSQGSLCQNLILWCSHVNVHACMRT